MKCPHCKKELDLPYAVRLNTETYGGGVFNVVSRCCGKAVKICTRRHISVNIELIGKGDINQAESWR